MASSALKTQQKRRKSTKPKEGYIRKALPSHLFEDTGFPDEQEYMRNLDYIPATTGAPVDFNVQLRAQRREWTIRLIICITMYNEEADELARTIRGVCDNIGPLSDSGFSWKEVLVVIVSDGRAKCHESTLTYMEEDLKILNRGMILEEYEDQAVTNHIFERTVQVTRTKSQGEYFLPLQMLLALKEKNGGKLNSHLWLFTAFCELLKPDYIVLLDVGTVPRPGAIAKLCDALEENGQLGGVCGEIVVRNPKIHKLLESAQSFEYKASHILDKSVESVFGYISVLPGAFSAYRWISIRNEPLAAYFVVEEHSLNSLGPFLCNMYLAEDRVLCFEIIAKARRRWTLHFVSGAVAETDVPQTLVELVKQRRRWLNGSFFSLIYFITRFGRFISASHSLPRKVGFVLQFLHSLLNLVLGWLMIGSMYLSLRIILVSTFVWLPSSTIFDYFFDLAYYFLFLLQVLVGLGGTINSTAQIYYVCMLVYGGLIILATTLGIVQALNSTLDTSVIFAMASSVGVYLYAAILHGEIVTITTTFVQYIFMLPTFINLFTTYSFCNMHDISWGTKEGNLQHEAARVRAKPTLAGAVANKDAAGAAASAASPAGILSVVGEAATEHEKLVAAEKQRKVDAGIAAAKAAAAVEFAAFRTRLLGAWLVSNWFYVTVITRFGFLSRFAEALALIIAVLMVYRVLGTSMYQLERLFKYLLVNVCCCFLQLRCGWCPSFLRCCFCCNNRPVRTRQASRRDSDDGRVFRRRGAPKPEADVEETADSRPSFNERARRSSLAQRSGWDSFDSEEDVSDAEGTPHHNNRHSVPPKLGQAKAKAKWESLKDRGVFGMFRAPEREPTENDVTFMDIQDELSAGVRAAESIVSRHFDPSLSQMSLGESKHLDESMSSPTPSHHMAPGQQKREPSWAVETSPPFHVDKAMDQEFSSRNSLRNEEPGGYQAPPRSSYMTPVEPAERPMTGRAAAIPRPMTGAPLTLGSMRRPGTQATTPSLFAGAGGQAASQAPGAAPSNQSTQQPPNRRSLIRASDNGQDAQPTNTQSNHTTPVTSPPALITSEQEPDEDDAALAAAAAAAMAELGFATSPMASATSPGAGGLLSANSLLHSDLLSPSLTNLSDDPSSGPGSDSALKRPPSSSVRETRNR